MSRRTKVVIVVSVIFIVVMLYKDDKDVTIASSRRNEALPDLAGTHRYRLPPIVSDKWIVVTSINPPTKDIKVVLLFEHCKNLNYLLRFQRLASLKDWNLVVVADRKTPKNWYYEDVHFLSRELQEKLGKT
ncbi:unnamed protein product [Strongylus vulgaris]|uniref:Uncharacterized protein n=1 Tax=Strongylus vulgaris TaxID=40348 RepID=A0A3P7JB90_STRVU|nr:unnamed protein product [Strongylus vulgaris]